VTATRHLVACSYTTVQPFVTELGKKEGKLERK